MLNAKLRIMMERNLLTFILSLALFGLMSANVFGQELNDGTANLPNLAQDADGTAVDEVTEGYPVPYYVTPDPILNSSYSEPYVLGGGTQGLNSTWNWTFGTAPVTSTQGDPSNNGPYIEVTWDAPGTSGDATSISVEEVGPAGSCTGNTKTLTVNVFDKPTLNVVEDGTGNGHNLVTELCETAVTGGQSVLLENIVDNGVSGGNFKFRFDIMVDKVDASQTQTSIVRDGVEQQDTVVTVPESYGNSVTLLSNYWMGAIDGDITRYRFDFGGTLYGGSQANGITDHIQRKSQYLANSAQDDQAWDYQSDIDTQGDGSMITFIIYPTPQTGNIHYVPNDFDL